MRKVWILYDGRAESGDTEEATVIEAIGNGRRDLRDALYNWQGHDAVLVEYDEEPTGENSGNLLNQRIIGHLREGRAALLKRCSSGSAGGYQPLPSTTPPKPPPVKP